MTTRHLTLPAVIMIVAGLDVATAIAAPPGSRTGDRPGSLGAASSPAPALPAPSVPGPPCDDVVGIDSIVEIVIHWGNCPPGPHCPGDFNNDGRVDVDDIVGAVVNWGWCQPALKIGPVDGLTTAWHDAPANAAVPVGTMLHVHQTASADASITWTGAVEIERTEHGSTAACPVDAASPHEIRADVDQSSPDGPVSMTFTCVVQGSPLAVDAIQVGVPGVVVETLDVDTSLDEAALNALTTDLYFGPSIAAVREVGPDQYRTSIERAVPFTVTVDPPEFRSMMEWRLDGVVAGLGPVISRTYDEIGVRQLDIAVGPTAGPSTESVEIETYRTIITSHDDTVDLLFEDTEYTFTAETEPPGYEDEITWLASTKYGTGIPVQGSGPVFTVRFGDTFGVDPVQGVWQWLGVKADQTAFNQDQKQPGACCFDFGFCQFITQTNCQVLGGVFLGEGIFCSPSPCTLEAGACCLPNGACMTAVDAVACNTIGGLFQGAGTVCPQTTCPPSGACCFDGGLCTDSFEADCVSAGGTFQGIGLTCNNAACPPNGACCFPSGLCSTGFGEDFCLDNGGIFLGEGADCAPNICPDFGACCLAPEPCQFLSEPECLDAGGFFTGQGVLCAAAVCPPNGACCLPTGACFIFPDTMACLDAGGMFEGEGMPCIGSDCFAPGACCNPDGSCTILTGAACDASGGTYQGTGTDCSPNPCSPPPTGACCLGNALCNMIFEFDCISAGGEFQGDGVPCNQVVCPPAGACCITNGLCAPTVEANCIGAGGFFRGIGTTCATAECAAVGACCLPDDTCGLADVATCDSFGGAFQGPGVPCSDVDCADVQACCFFDGDCLDLAPNLCSGAGAAPQGVGTACALLPVPCVASGACCLPGGVCQTLDEVSCAAGGGTIDEPGSNCGAFNPCAPGTGECCVRSGNGTPGCDEISCEGAVCFLQPDCCNIEWDSTCAAMANASCDDCDNEGTGDCCAPDGNGTTGCDDGICEAIVCNALPDCCSVVWDATCAAEAQAICALCGGGSGGGCCFADTDAGCSDAECETIVCDLMPFCCAAEWNDACADLAVANCDICSAPGCGTAESCQAPDQMAHGSGSLEGVFSDMDSSAVALDNIQVLETGTITSTCWWGFYIDVVNLSICGPAAGDTFFITYFNDSGGVPGTLHAGPFEVVPEFGATGLVIPRFAFFFDVPEYQFSAEHPAVPIVQGACYWVEIRSNMGGSGCNFAWSTSPDGDGLSMTTGGQLADDFDFAFCVNATTTGNGCGNVGIGDCCAPEGNGSAGCEDAVCEAVVCNVRPECCDLIWDATCAAEAQMICALCGGGEPGGNCCFADDGAGCNDPECETIVCDLLPFCCAAEWNDACADLAVANCDLCSAPGCAAAVNCQSPDQMGHGAESLEGVFSDMDSSAVVLDNFRAAADGSITSVCWWGFYIDLINLSICGPAVDDTFFITYFEDDGGMPGVVHAGPFEVIPEFGATGLTIPKFAFFFDVPEYQFQTVHPAVPVDQDACYWIEIRSNMGGTGCNFAWSTSPDGDGLSMTTGGNLDDDFDFAFCVDAETTGTGCSP